LNTEVIIMSRKSLLFALLLSGSQFCAAASDNKDAASRYEADKKLCAEETNSGARMQCLRDAKEEYTKASARASDTGAARDAHRAAQEKAASRYEADKKLCAEETNSGARMRCLRDAKEEYTKATADATRPSNGGGASKAGVPACADCGMIAGVTAGKRDGQGGPLGMLTATKFWSVLIKLDSGELRTVEFDHEPGVKSGDLVKVQGSTITRR
jgi:hypothetical protein